MTDDELDRLDKLLKDARKPITGECTCTNHDWLTGNGHLDQCPKAASYHRRSIATADLSREAVYALPSLLTLARRGLRAEREVCANCGKVDAAWCAEWDHMVKPGDYCFLFHAKDGG